MIIACPECKTRYVVSPAAIGENGRRVQCSRCRAIWFQAPPPVEAEVVPEQVILSGQDPQKATKAPEEGQEEVQEEGLPSGKDQSPKAEKEAEDPVGIFGNDFKTNVPAVVRNPSRGILMGWILLGVFLVGVGGSAYFFRDWFEKNSEVAKILYQKWDVLVLGEKLRPPAPPEPVSILKPHASSYLTLRQTSEIRFEGEKARLTVMIEVRNSANFNITLPPLVGVIRNANGIEIFSWTEPLEMSVVSAHSALQFQAKLDDIPPEAAEAEVAFNWR